MNLFIRILLLCIAAAINVIAARAETATPLAAALSARTITLESHGNSRDQLTLTLKNATGAPATVSIPAGLIAAGAKPDSRVILLREAKATVAPGSTVDVSLPVVALTSKNAAAEQPFTLQATTEPRLASLIKLLADQPDAPRPTMQLAVLALLEDVNFAQWRQFLGTSHEAQPTPAEVTQAVDALGLLRQASPQGTFALANDTELKLRALRNPWSRGKAMALYGLDAGLEAAAPDLRQLLHTQAGDNCPICRQRALMQKPGDIP